MSSSHNKLIFGFATLRPNLLRRTSDSRQPLAEIAMKHKKEVIK